MSAAYAIIDFAFVLSQCKIFTLRYTLDTYAKIIFITLQDINFTAIMCIENIAAGTADYSIIFSTELNNTVFAGFCNVACCGNSVFNRICRHCCNLNFHLAFGCTVIACINSTALIIAADIHIEES